MKVWTNRRFEGHWPVGTAAVVVAESAEQAALLLNEELRKVGLSDSKPEQFEEMPADVAGARVLCDGDY